MILPPVSLPATRDGDPRKNRFSGVCAESRRTYIGDIFSTFPPSCWLLHAPPHYVPPDIMIYLGKIESNSVYPSRAPDISQKTGFIRDYRECDTRAVGFGALRLNELR